MGGGGEGKMRWKRGRKEDRKKGRKSRQGGAFEYSNRNTIT